MSIVNYKKTKLDFRNRKYFKPTGSDRQWLASDRKYTNGCKGSVSGTGNTLGVTGSNLALNFITSRKDSQSDIILNAYHY